MTHETSQTREKWPDQLLYVECPTDWTVLFGSELILFGESEVFWDDLAKRRSFAIKQIQHESDAKLVLERSPEEVFPTPGGIYTFQPMTLDLYETVIKQRLGWDQSFHTIEELQAFIFENK